MFLFVCLFEQLTPSLQSSGGGSGKSQLGRLVEAYIAYGVSFDEPSASESEHQQDQRKLNASADASGSQLYQLKPYGHTCKP